MSTFVPIDDVCGLLSDKVGTSLKPVHFPDALAFVDSQIHIDDMGFNRDNKFFAVDSRDLDVSPSIYCVILTSQHTAAGFLDLGTFLRDVHFVREPDLRLSDLESLLQHF